MAWQRGDPLLSIRCTDGDGRSTVIKIRLPAAAAFADLETYATTLAGLIATVTDVMVSDVILTVPAEPDGTATPVATPLAKAEVEKKAAFLWGTTDPKVKGRFTIPGLNFTYDDGGVPPVFLAEGSGQGPNINIDNATLDAVLSGLYATDSASINAANIYGCVAVKGHKYPYIGAPYAAYKQHRDSLQGDSGAAGSNRRVG